MTSLKLPFSSDWAKKAHIGITATTGQLADNHDVISLLAYSDFQVMETEEAAQADKKYFEPATNLKEVERILR